MFFIYKKRTLSAIKVTAVDVFLEKLFLQKAATLTSKVMANQMANQITRCQNLVKKNQNIHLLNLLDCTVINEDLKKSLNTKVTYFSL